MRRAWRGARGIELAHCLGVGALVASMACNDVSTSVPLPPPVDAGPAVQSVAPAAQAIVAPRDAAIEIVFDEAVDPSTATAEAIRVFGRWSGVMTGTVSLLDDDTRLRFVPDREFAAGELVTVTLTRTIADAAGEARGTGYSWGFWTQAGAGTLDQAEVDRFSVRQTGEGRVQAYGAFGGDLDGDGFPDLMIPNEISADVRVFMNDGAGGYATFDVYPIAGGAVPSTNEGADFNGDGLMDFAVGNAGNERVSVFMGLGAGQFEHAGNVDADDGVRGLCVLDADGDGDTDIVTANRAGSSVTVLLGDGAGGFAPASNGDVGGDGETACATVDADEDGIPDIAIGAINSSELIVLFGNGGGGFAASDPIAAGGGPWMLAAGDVNGDGHGDVLSANAGQNTFSVLLGDGAGGFTLDDTYPVGQTPLAIDVGDLDGDGDLDVVTSNFQSADWTVYENLGDGAFGNPRTLFAGSAGSCATLHDRDGDGDLDVTGIDEIDDLVVLFENG